MIPSRSNAAPHIALPWIIRLRYAMVLGQIATAVVVNSILHIDLPLRWIFIVPVIVVLSNLWLSNRVAARNRPGKVADSSLVAGMFVLDTMCLTAVLMLTGGPNNPFSLLYLVHITLSATILRRRQTWALGALACLCFALLFRFYHPIPALEMHRGNGGNLHLIGMWVAFATATLMVTSFSGRISELLREREESLLHMQEELARKDRLASLVTLAAGAAHELSTPLGTIAVVAKELERYAVRTVRDVAFADDCRLIRAEVDRCREILQRMSIEGAEPAGEALGDLALGDLLAAVQDSFPVPGRLRIDVAPEERAAMLTVPRHAVEQALIALIRNALDASADDDLVGLSVSRSDDRVRFEVKDSGCGMSSESLRHAGEPFFTTKEPGKGMGLGIFLVRTLASRLGGQLILESSPGIGTSATLELPLVRAREPVAT